MKNKLTFSTSKPDPETIAFVAKKIQEAHLLALSNALAEAERAVRDGRTTTIRSKGIKIEVSRQ